MYSRCFCWFPGPLAPSAGNGRGSAGSRVDSRENAKIVRRSREMRYVYWSADSTPIGDTKGRGRVGTVGDRCRPEYCQDRQLINEP